MTKSQTEAFADLVTAVVEIDRLSHQMLDHLYGKSESNPDTVEAIDRLAEQAAQQLSVIRLNAGVLREHGGM